MASVDTPPIEALRQIIGRTSGEGFPTGDLAELRRLTADSTPGAAFWRLLADVHPALLERDHREPVELSERRDANQRRWQVAVAALVTLRAHHNPRVSLGTALAESRYSELRLARLLRASPPTLFDELRAASHYLDAHACDVDLVELGLLAVLSQGGAAEVLRRKVAAMYYRSVHQTKET